MEFRFWLILQNQNCVVFPSVFLLHRKVGMPSWVAGMWSTLSARIRWLVLWATLPAVLLVVYQARTHRTDAIAAAEERTAFLDYMSTMYRRMLNEHLDGMGEERGRDR